MTLDPYTQQVAAYEPTAVYPAAPVQPYAASGPITYVTGANGQLVAVRADLLPQAPIQQPVIMAPPQRDPWPARLAGCGICAAGIGWGASMLFTALAAAATALTALAACLAIAWVLKISSGGGGRSGSTTIHNTNHVTIEKKGWFSR